MDIVSDEIHDGHESHYQGSSVKYQGSHSDRAVRLYRDNKEMPERVVVYPQGGQRPSKVRIVLPEGMLEQLEGIVVEGEMEQERVKRLGQY